MPAKRFNYTGSIQTLTLPKICRSIVINAYGAKGGGIFDTRNNRDYGGYGGRAYGRYYLKQTDQRQLNIFVGGSNGYNGGGIGYFDTYNNLQTNGGGATDIRLNGTNLINRIIVAAGGGSAGGSYGQSTAGGAGGGLSGYNGSIYACTVGYGASQTSGGNGINVGSFGVGGNGSNGGAGGGGYYGGGGTSYYGGGGGGSSYINLLDSSTRLTTPGINNSNGYAIVSYYELFMIKINNDLYNLDSYSLPKFNHKQLTTDKLFTDGIDQDISVILKSITVDGEVTTPLKKLKKFKITKIK